MNPYYVKEDLTGQMSFNCADSIPISRLFGDGDTVDILE